MLFLPLGEASKNEIVARKRFCDLGPLKGVCFHKLKVEWFIPE